MKTTKKIKNVYPKITYKWFKSSEIFNGKQRTNISAFKINQDAFEFNISSFTRKPISDLEMNKIYSLGQLRLKIIIIFAV